MYPMPLGRSWTPGTRRNTSSTRVAPVFSMSDASRKCPWRLFRRRSNPTVARYVEPATVIGASTCTVSPRVISTRRTSPGASVTWTRAGRKPTARASRIVEPPDTSRRRNRPSAPASVRVSPPPALPRSLPPPRAREAAARAGAASGPPHTDHAPGPPAADEEKIRSAERPAVELERDHGGGAVPELPAQENGHVGRDIAEHRPARAVRTGGGDSGLLAGRARPEPELGPLRRHRRGGDRHPAAATGIHRQCEHHAGIRERIVGTQRRVHRPGARRGEIG